ncbi:MAG: hypothetical protein J2P17_00465 [Mycobacterium sp.]|nr:hypothetical protein [Mycobacterium sp.]
MLSRWQYFSLTAASIGVTPNTGTDTESVTKLLEEIMINGFRRTAIALAALAVIAGAGVGTAAADTPEAAGPVHTAIAVQHTGFDPLCIFGGGFNWHYYNYCDQNYWRGSHFGDWQRFDRDHRGYDYHWHH